MGPTPTSSTRHAREHGIVRRTPSRVSAWLLKIFPVAVDRSDILIRCVAWRAGIGKACPATRYAALGLTGPLPSFFSVPRMGFPPKRSSPKSVPAVPVRPASQILHLLNEIFSSSRKTGCQMIRP